MANVTAFVLDDTVAVGAEGATIPGVPGLWFHDRPTLPAALQYTVQEMRDAIEALGLPLKEVKVAESEAHDSFPETPGKLASAQVLPGGQTAEAPALELTTEPDPDVLDTTLERAEDEGE